MTTPRRGLGGIRALVLVLLLVQCTLFLRMGEYVLRLANASRERVVIPGDLSHAPSTEDLWAPPKVGDIAPGFSLSQLDSDDLVALSDFQGARPVVLVFGSFT